MYYICILKSITMNIQKIIDSLIYEPVTKYRSCGNEIQLCKVNYNGIDIYERTVFYWNIFKDPKTINYIDLILPMDTKVENGVMSDNYYTEEGYGIPIFNNLEDAVTFIVNYQK